MDYDQSINHSIGQLLSILIVQNEITHDENFAWEWSKLKSVYENKDNQQLTLNIHVPVTIESVFSKLSNFSF